MPSAPPSEGGGFLSQQQGWAGPLALDGLLGEEETQQLLPHLCSAFPKGLAQGKALNNLQRK